jgi:tRNA-dihydrouridine synthase
VARKHLTWYCTGLENAEEFRLQAVRVEKASEQIRLTQQFFGRQTEGDCLAA